MIFIDMMAPRGHVTINKFYLKTLWSDGDTLITGESLKNEFNEFPTIIFDDSECNKYSRFRLSIFILINIPLTKNKKVVFLSYDLLYMPIIAFVLRIQGWQISVFEHNTIPITFLKKTWQLLIGRKLQHFTYAPFVNDMFLKLGLSATTIAHPLVMKNENTTGPDCISIILGDKAKTFRYLIFCPSGSVNLHQLQLLIEKHTEVYFVIKSLLPLKRNNVLVKPFFENYQKIMEMCNYVYIPFDKIGKVSGPVFDALAMNKMVIVRDNVFGRYIRSIFPLNIFFESENFLTINSNPKKIDMIQYNNNIVKQLRSKLGF